MEPVNVGAGGSGGGGADAFAPAKDALSMGIVELRSGTSPGLGIPLGSAGGGDAPDGKGSSDGHALGVVISMDGRGSSENCGGPPEGSGPIEKSGCPAPSSGGAESFPAGPPSGGVKFPGPEKFPDPEKFPGGMPPSMSSCCVSSCCVSIVTPSIKYVADNVGEFSDGPWSPVAEVMLPSVTESLNPSRSIPASKMRSIRTITTHQSSVSGYTSWMYEAASAGGSVQAWGSVAVAELRNDISKLFASTEVSSSSASLNVMLNVA